MRCNAFATQCPLVTRSLPDKEGYEVLPPSPSPPNWTPLIGAELDWHPPCKPELVRKGGGLVTGSTPVCKLDPASRLPSNAPSPLTPWRAWKEGHADGALHPHPACVAPTAACRVGGGKPEPP